MRTIFILLCGLCVGCSAPKATYNSAEKKGVNATEITLPTQQASDSLYTKAHLALNTRLNAPPPPTRAKNIILMVADGLDPTTVTAARIYDGQMRGEDGEANVLAFERFSNLAMAKTYTTDFQVPDSAGTITAMMTGVKTRSGVINYGPNILRGQCASAAGNQLIPITALAEQHGMMTGVVSTARLTHATPAAAYASAVDRGWEDDSNLPKAAKDAGCTDIASQLLDTSLGDGLDVVLGGGAANFLPKADSQIGRREDGRNLAREWADKSPNHTYITHTDAVLALRPNQRPLGLFSASHMDYALDRDNSPIGQPSLAQMTEAAIRILETSEKGYVLVVEGGRVDHAHHGGNAARALADAQAFSEAVGIAREMTSSDDTLIIATADHGHTMTMSGYPIKGNPILGAASVFRKAKDGKTYTTLTYATGPGANFLIAPETERNERPDVPINAAKDKDYVQQALIPLGSETHGGQDVGIYADGPSAWLFTGTVEQNYVFHVMAYALGFELTASSEPHEG